MSKFKVIRIYVVEGKTKAQVWKWLKEAKPDELEKLLDFQTVKEIVPDTWLRSIVKQVTGK